jgi:preprotein translocase subunit SecG
MDSMQMVQTVLLILQVLVAVSLIGFILIQQGKGADAGAAFGSGASATVFGSRGSANFLTRTTAVLALVFLTNSLVLSYLAVQRIHREQSVMEANGGSPVTVTAPAEIPAAPPADVPSEPARQESEVPALPDNQP